jgi:hypothetical protein
MTLSNELGPRLPGSAGAENTALPLHHLDTASKHPSAYSEAERHLDPKPKRDLVIYDEQEVAWTSSQIQAAAESGAPSFVRRVELQFLSDEPRDRDISIEDILDLAEKAQDDLRAIVGIDVIEPEEWGLVWVKPGPNRLYAQQPGKLTVADHALVAKVPAIQGIRPLSEQEGTALHERLLEYGRMPTHPSGCRLCDLRLAQFAVAPPDATHDRERIILLDCDLIFERDSWTTPLGSTSRKTG